jgi:hypothetical protein
MSAPAFRPMAATSCTEAERRPPARAIALSYQMRRRSNGSLSGPGSAPAASPMSKRDREWNESLRVEPGAKISGNRRDTGELADPELGSDPQADAALTKTALLSPPIAARAVRDSAVSPAIHQRKACVSSSRFNVYRSQTASSSSGKGSKNSGPTETMPRNAPNWRLAPTG